MSVVGVDGSAAAGGPGAAHPEPYDPPPEVSARVSVSREDLGGWPVFVVAPRGARAFGDGAAATPAAVRADAGHVLFLHGGGYVAELTPLHWNLIASLVERSGAAFTVPVYPLLPGATHRDVFPTLRRIYDRAVSRGSAWFTVMGDSVGATLGLALVQSLPPETTRPGDVVLLSPALDATLENPAIAAVERSESFAPQREQRSLDRRRTPDPMSTRDGLLSLFRLFAGGEDLSDPRLSPINGPLAGLGTVTAFIGGRDLLGPDVRRFAELAGGAPGTRVVVREYAGMVHDWMILPIPGAAEAAEEIARLLIGMDTAGSAVTE